MNDIERRRLMKFLLAGPALYPASSYAFWFFGDEKKSQKTKQILHWKGNVRINGKPLAPGALILPGDTIETGENSELIFKHDKDAHLLRSNTRLTLNNNNGIVDTLRLISGALLSVFGRGDKKIHTPVATIGIRGTGTYFEVTDRETYLCTCYGSTQIASNEDPSITDAVTTRHHEAPRFIRNSLAGPVIEEAPVRNHSDAELILLESTVGREPPFVDDPFAEDPY